VGPFFRGQEMGWMDTYLDQVEWFQLATHARYMGENPFKVYHTRQKEFNPY
jgi:hypothetical protein